jgi:hypothetical protein
MPDDLFLVIQLDDAAEAAPAKPPLVLSHRAAGMLEDGALGPALDGGVVVYSGPAGWVACDRATREVKSLAEGAFVDLGGWRFKLVDERGAATAKADGGHVAARPARDPEQSPFILIHDSARTDPAPRRELLPTRDGTERIVGRTRAEGRIVLEDRRVSRDHLRFYSEGGVIHVENLSQFPPTLEVNGEHGRITGRMKLPNGARIRLGASLIEFQDPLESGFAPAAGGDEVGTPMPRPLPADPALGVGSPDPSVQEGFDWVEKTLILIALLLVVWIVYFLLP